MGILTRISDEYDDSAKVHRIFAVTKFGVKGSRANLNRLSGRAAVMTGVGQRTLVAAAYDKEDVDLVWNKGLGFTEKLERKFPKAQEINYRSMHLEEASEILDVLPHGIKDMIKFGDIFDEQLHIWEIPYELE